MKKLLLYLTQPLIIIDIILLFSTLGIYSPKFGKTIAYRTYNFIKKYKI